MAGNFVDHLKTVNESQFYICDVENLAYIKRVQYEQGIGYAVYSADGMQLAIFPNRDAAFYTARQHELDPLSVH